MSYRGDPRGDLMVDVPRWWYSEGKTIATLPPVSKFMEKQKVNCTDMTDEKLDAIYPTGHSLEAVQQLHKDLCAEALALVSKKGSDYNRTEQASGDTLANLKASARIGLVETPAHGVLVRLLDKIMRLKSLCRPGEKPANADEKVRDTVVDIINYAVYVLALTETQG